MIMKQVSQRMLKEIEYLGALAEMYEQDNNSTAQEATRAAIAALRRLVEVIDHAGDDSSQGLPVAA
jgi:hypothetical protein